MPLLAFSPQSAIPRISWACCVQPAQFLDEAVPLAQGASYSQVTGFRVVGGGSGGGRSLAADLGKGGTVGLLHPAKFVASSAGAGEEPRAVGLRNNGLHIIIEIDRSDRIGRTHPAGVSGVVLESALTAIADCEDSVAAVDGEDKAQVYTNWTNIMKGTLVAEFKKGGSMVKRTLKGDRSYAMADGSGTLLLPGRCVMLVRNVGIHMYTDAVVTAQGGQEIPEGILDALVTACAARHDLTRPSPLNSRAGSMYIVKPKMHGPAEVEFVNELFAAVEDALELPRYTLKMGIMDEERRTTVNLAACMAAARHRVVFINTGFLDRTGDEIHTCMHAPAPVLPKGQIKAQPWRLAYEDWNVDVGLALGLAPGRGQIGKGMWAEPDNMKVSESVGGGMVVVVVVGRRYLVPGVGCCCCV